MKLVTSVELREQDIEVLQDGFNKGEFFEEYLLAKIKTEFADPLGKGASLLLQLLEAGSLEIQINNDSIARSLPLFHWISNSVISLFSVI